MTDMDEHHLDALPPVEDRAEHATNVPPPETPASTPHEKQTTVGLEQAAAGFVDPTTPAAGASLPPLPPLPPLPISSTSPADPATPAVAATPAANPLIADDADLIEKEWVMKAKQIVEHTKHDPFRQNEEMTKMKADYLSKRYGRDIKESKG